MPSRVSKTPSKEKAQVVFGATLRGFREAQALTQEALAERADLHTNGVVAQMPVAADVGSGDERDELGSG